MVYKPSQNYIDRIMSNVEENNRPMMRLRIDVAALLTGPTSLEKASDLAFKLVRSDGASSPLDTATAMREAADRYLGAHEGTSQESNEEHEEREKRIASELQKLPKSMLNRMCCGTSADPLLKFPRGVGPDNASKEDMARALARVLMPLDFLR